MGNYFNRVCGHKADSSKNEGKFNVFSLGALNTIYSAAADIYFSCDLKMK